MLVDFFDVLSVNFFCGLMIFKRYIVYYFLKKNIVFCIFDRFVYCQILNVEIDCFYFKQIFIILYRQFFQNFEQNFVDKFYDLIFLKEYYNL